MSRGQHVLSELVQADGLQGYRTHSCKNNAAAILHTCRNTSHVPNQQAATCLRALVALTHVQASRQDCECITSSEQRIQSEILCQVCQSQAQLLLLHPAVWLA